jgi:hypothetical protein
LLPTLSISMRGGAVQLLHNFFTRLNMVRKGGI